jgi:hypothetical protein
MNTVSPYCKVWKASPALLSAIRSIPIKDIPKHPDESAGVDTWAMGYAECLTCGSEVEPHTDWIETFGLVCISGGGTFILGEPDGIGWGQTHADMREVDDMTNKKEWKVSEGTCLQFWGLAPHSFSSENKSNTFLTIKVDREKLAFLSKKEFEAKAEELIRKR